MAMIAEMCLDCKTCLRPGAVQQRQEKGILGRWRQEVGRYSRLQIGGEDAKLYIGNGTSLAAPIDLVAKKLMLVRV